MLGAAECGLVRDDEEAQCLATIHSGLSAGMKFPYPPLEPQRSTTITYAAAQHLPGGLLFKGGDCST
jgi:hypothetical protein